MMTLAAIACFIGAFYAGPDTLGRALLATGTFLVLWSNTRDRREWNRMMRELDKQEGTT